MPRYLSIDQGSHASRALIFDGRGRTISTAWASIATSRPRRGWVEHEAADVARATRDAIDGAWRRAGRPPIAAAALATQRSTIVCWDRVTGLPLSPAVSWQDRRNERCVAALRAHAAEVRARTGLLLSAHYGASKLRWCWERLAAVRAAGRRGRLAWGPLASFLLHALLEERPLLADPANASRTLLYDLEEGDWSEELLELFGLPREPLPDCVPTEHPFGHLRLGRRGAAPLRVCTGDQSAVPFCLGRPDGRSVFVNLGTGAFIQRTVGSTPVRRSGLLTSVLCARRGSSLYVLEGTVNGAAAAIDRYAARLRADPEQALPARDSPRPGDGTPLFLNGVSGLGSPYWRPIFPSRFVGRGAPAHRLQAVVESVLFLVAVNLRNLESATGPVQRIVVTGGLAANRFICQGLAELSGARVVRPETVEATARGAAFLLDRRAAAWSRISVERFEPGGCPGLRRRFRLWRAAMAAALAR